MIRVILCDDHALIRRGIRDTLADEPDMRIVGEAADYIELHARRASWIAAVEDRLRGYDALLLPTVPVIAPRR